MDSSQHTTFGAIVERKPKSTSSSPALSQSANSPAFSHLHLSSTNQYIEPPFPSPYDMPDLHNNDHPDLENGLYTHPNISTHEDPNQPRMLPIQVPSRSTPSPMLGEILEEEEEDEDSISNAPTITNNTPNHNALPTIITTSPTRPSIPPTTNSSARTPSNHTHTPSSSSTTEKAHGATVTTLTMWPTQKEVKAKAKADKLARNSCNPLARLSKRTRVIVSVTIALTVIGAAVGIGVGISRAYGGSVWAGNGRTMPISGHSGGGE
jgi:hypothetical protein